MARFEEGPLTRVMVTGCYNREKRGCQLFDSFGFVYEGRGEGHGEGA